MKRSVAANHTGHDDASNTAMRGASLAFRKITAKPATTVNKNNGALIAATSASRDHSVARSPSPSPQTTSNIGGTGRNHGPGNHRSMDPRSPSLIAATLAASRSESSPKTAPSTQVHADQVAQKQSRRATSNVSTASSITDLDLTTDSSSIGATNAIISFFEQKQAGTVPIKSTAVSSVRKELRIGLRPLTPPRIMSPVVTYDTSPSRLASSSAWVKTAPSSPSAGQNMARPNLPLHHAGCSLNGERRPPTPPERKKKHAEPLASTASSLINPSRRPRSATPPPKPVVRANTIVLSPQSRPVSSQRVINISSFEHLRFPDHPQPDSHIQRQISAAKTTTPPAGSINGESIRGTLTRGSSSSLSNNTFVSAASVLSQQADSPHRNNTGSPRPEVSRSRRPPSGPPALPSRPLVLRQNNPGPQIPLSSLTNAIVAGSLASARARPSTLGSLTPPPQKPTPHIRQTLRARQSKSDEDAAGHRPHHRKKPLGKLGSRNKHAHHEGARKRWREEITAHERQRYEGVWASNRGLLLDSPSAAAGGLQDINMTQLVANAVVRDIWARSRLPFDELAEVWDLVDTQGKGVLDKAEFVVGMWLIDQRLRGRKIPRKVSDSVWGSAKGVRVLGVKGKR